MKKKPNVIIIYADDLGYGDIGCYGAEEIKTPNLDSLCTEGLKFTDGYSASAVCTPARYSLLTGEYPYRNSGAFILPGNANCIIDGDKFTLPKVFKEAGYTTAVVGKWHLGLGCGEEIDWNKDIPFTPNDVGFDYSFIFPATADRVPCVYLENRKVLNLDPDDPISVSYEYDNPYPEMPTGREHPELLKMQASHGHDMAIVNGVGRIGYMRGGKKALWKDENLARDFSARALSFIEQNKSAPFFLYYALHQPHVPRLPSPEFAGITKLGARGDVIAEADFYVGKLIERLKEAGLYDDTIIIFSSDNGPVLDDGYVDEAVTKNGEHRPAGALRGGKYSRFEGGIRVPFTVTWKNEIKPGVSNAIVGQVDMVASFASLLGIKLPENAAPDSLDMTAALIGKSAVGRNEIVGQDSGCNKVLRSGKWAYIAPCSDRPAFLKATGIESAADPMPQLYNLDYDIGEKRNVAAVYPEIASAMDRRIKEITGK